LDDEDTGRNILQALRDNLHRKYPGTTEPLDIAVPLSLVKRSKKWAAQPDGAKTTAQDKPRLF
jgi:hypothetical protein